MLSQSMSTAGPSFLRPTGFAETILIITVLLSIFCVVAVALRTWQRLRDQNFHVDDGVTWLGLMFNLFQYAVTAWGTTVGIGSPDSMLSMSMLRSTAQAAYWIEMTYVLAMGFTKASICSTLLRITQGAGHWKITCALWFLIFGIATSTLAAVLYSAIRCDTKGCKDSHGTMFGLYFLWVGFYIVVDITLAVVPVLIIRGLNMKKSLKLSLGVILAMGGVACLASVIRIPARLDVDGVGGDKLYKLGSVVLWSEVETALGIITCCLPMMRRLLVSFNADHDHATAVTPGRSAYFQPGSSGHSGHACTNNNRGPCRVPDEEKALSTLEPTEPQATNPPAEHAHRQI